MRGTLSSRWKVRRCEGRIFGLLSVFCMWYAGRYANMFVKQDGKVTMKKHQASRDFPRSFWSKIHRKVTFCAVTSRKSA
jgi:hypothetical protein